MAEKKIKKKRPRKVVALDGDKLGMIGGMLGATVVLMIGFFSQTGTITATLIRMGWVFVVCYGAIFFLVRVILRTTLKEMIEEERALRREKEADAKAANVEAMAEGALARKAGEPKTKEEAGIRAATREARAIEMETLKAVIKDAEE